ncbi:lipoate--protein ligase [Vagococcus fluvialis]|uniref:lipoate--protein ligase n=1 Tax=Vagococcus fluvialis TaxID=2738 RepID=UPI003D09A72E
MLFHRMASRDIRINLATEDYLMNHYETSEPILLMYIQNPCVIVGKHQNVFEEVAIDVVKAEGVTLTRRLSGGGAVYDDLGNISFSFVIDKSQNTFGDYLTIVQPIVDALKEMGIEDVAVNGRNDILIGDKKISGNAMYTKKNKMFSHGTLLHDVDLTRLPNYLTISKEKLRSKHIQSVESRVTNIKPHLNIQYQKLTTEEFRDELLKRIYQVESIEDIQSKEIILSEFDKAKITKQVTDLYANEDWIYGHHQPYSLKERAYIKGVGLIESQMEVESGKISAVYFTGDYFNQKDMNELTEKLIGSRLTKESLKTVLSHIEISHYFNGLDLDTFTTFLVGELNDDPIS